MAIIRVAQVGTFGADNWGNLLSPIAFHRVLGEVASELGTLVDCTVFSPRELRAGAWFPDQPGTVALERLDAIDAETPFDVIFIGGGDFIHDEYASGGRESCGNTKSVADFTALASPTSSPKSRLVLLMPGVPCPLSRSSERFLKKSFRRLKFGAARDRVSADRLSTVIPVNMNLAVLPDVIAALPHFYPRAHFAALDHGLVSNRSRRSGYICFQGNAGSCPDIFCVARALHRLEQRTGFDVVLLATGNSPGELIFLRRLAYEFQFAMAGAPPGGPPATLMQKVAVIAEARAYIGTDPQGSILAHSYDVPHVCSSGAEMTQLCRLRETCGGGTCCSGFAECLERLDEISQTTGSPGVSHSQDYAQIKRFIRKTLVPGTEQWAGGSAGYEPGVDGRISSYQEVRKTVEARIDSMHCPALAMRKPRLQVLARRVIKVLWWSISLQLAERHRQRQRWLTRHPNVRHRALAVPLPWASKEYTEPSVAVICHLFYPEMAAEMMAYLNNLSFTFVLCITTDTCEKKAAIEQTFQDWQRARVEIQLTENRGRDIAAKLLAFGDIYRQYDYVLHIHSKLSPYDPHLAGWRQYLLDTLIGSPEIVDSIFEVFRTLPEVGMIAPQHMPAVRARMNWECDREYAVQFCQRVGLNLAIDAGTDFPSGSMFWARSAALLPILSIGLTFDDFPLERGQLGGTLGHVIERLYFSICEAAGYDWMLIEKQDIDGDEDEQALRAATPDELKALAGSLSTLIVPR